MTVSNDTTDDVNGSIPAGLARTAGRGTSRLRAGAAAAMGLLALVGATGTNPAPSTAPGRAGPSVVPASGPLTLNAGGAGFPQYSQGLKRLAVLDAPMLERLKASISVPATPGRRLAVRMSCTPTDNTVNMNEWSTRMLAKFTGPGRTGSAGCGLPDHGYDLIGVATSAKATVVADVFVDHASPGPGLFKDAKIHVAIYESVPWQDYSFPPRPANLDTSPGYAWSNDPGTVRVLGPKTAQEANRALTFTQPFDAHLGLNLQGRGPGRMRVLINGKDISAQIGDSMQTQDKLISFWGYDPLGFEFPLDPATFFDPQGTAGLATPPRAPVTVTIATQDFQGPDWRVEVAPLPGNGG
jgi:hypothetical protein